MRNCKEQLGALSKKSSNRGLGSLNLNVYMGLEQDRLEREAEASPNKVSKV